MPSNDDEPSFAPKQREVQRKLGRCLIRLQQLELLVKAIWVDHEYASYPDEFLGVQAKRKADISNKTLGIVIKQLSETYLTPNLGKPDEALEEGPEPRVDEKRIFVRIKSNIDMSEEQYQHTVSGLKMLVDLRNDLVHHFLERFNLCSDDGCEAASCYLDECYARIDGQVGVIHGWARSRQSAAESLAAFMQSDEALIFLNRGRMPDGTVHWDYTPVVQALRQAESILSKDGWTALGDAISWLRREYPEETPGRYNCSRWRHLLHESRLFDIRRLCAVGENAESGTVFRSRQASQ